MNSTESDVPIAVFPRPKLPYRVQVAESDVSVQFMQYFSIISPEKVYPCVIQALVEIYEAAIYDHGDAPLRGDLYKLHKYDVLIDVQRYPRRSTASLTYAAVVRMLQAYELFTHDYGSYGMFMYIFLHGDQVADVEIREVSEKGNEVEKA